MSVFAAKPDRPRRLEAALASSPVTIIARGSRFTGDIQADGVLQIEGAVAGGVRSAARVVVTGSGHVMGDIEAPEIVVAGTIEGDLHADDRVELQEGGQVHGDVLSPRVAMLEGAVLNGLLRTATARAA